MQIRDLAIYTAGAAHQAQMYGESSYIYHLSSVDTELNSAGYDQHSYVRVAAWLHDTLEDTKASYTQLDITFGSEVADLVQAVTDEPGANRAERHRATYPKIRANEQAVALKLADRIANISHSLLHFSKQGQMYLREHVDFVNGIRDASHSDTRVGRLWYRYNELILCLKERYKQV